MLLNKQYTTAYGDDISLVQLNQFHLAFFMFGRQVGNEVCPIKARIYGLIETIKSDMHHMCCARLLSESSAIVGILEDLKAAE